MDMILPSLISFGLNRSSILVQHTKVFTWFVCLLTVVVVDSI